MKPHEALLRFWSESDAKIKGAPAREAEIAKLETRFDVRFPEDFRAYLLNAVPRLGESMDDNLVTWWSTSRIASDQTINDQPITVDGDPANAHKYLIFADYLIWSWAWAIACGDTDQRGKIIVLGNPQRERVVADDFAAFVDLSIRDHDSLDWL